MNSPLNAAYDADNKAIRTTSSGSSSSITSVTPGTGASNLGKAEDTAHSSGDVGVFDLSVANEAQTTLAVDGDYIGRSADTKGNTMAVGSIASGATDSGNPVKVGAKYNSTLPTFTDGQRGDLQINVNGGLILGGGTIASGATDSGNPIKVGTKFNTTQPTYSDGQRAEFQTNSRGELKVVITNATTSAAVAAPADGSSAATTVLGTTSRGLLYNGSTFDMARAAANATNSTGTGIASAALVAQLDDTSPTTITENQFGNVRMTSNRALMVEQAFSYGRVTADGQIKGSAGFLHTVNIAATGVVTAGVVTIYDSLTETGNVIWSGNIPTGVSPTPLLFDVSFGTGLFVGFDGTIANVQVTCSYR